MLDHYAEDDRWFEANKRPCFKCQGEAQMWSGQWVCFSCALAELKAT